MLVSFIERWDDISSILNQPSKKKNDKQVTKMKHLAEFKSISVEELILLRDFLKPFKTASDEIEATKCPTLHLVHPWYRELLSHMQSDVKDPKIISDLKAIGIAYWTENVQHHITSYHDIAVFLHPAMKSLKPYTHREQTIILKKTEEMLTVFGPPIATKQSKNNEKVNNNTRFARHAIVY